VGDPVVEALRDGAGMLRWITAEDVREISRTYRSSTSRPSVPRARREKRWKCARPTRAPSWASSTATSAELACRSSMRWLHARTALSSVSSVP
jgi:hypothetical protein